MATFEYLHLRCKLLLNFILSSGIPIVALVFSLFQPNSIRHDSGQLTSDNIPSLRAAVASFSV